jgi:hypothetical protein
LAGRAEAVQLLLERGVDADAPHCLPVGLSGRSFEQAIFVTPLCAARLMHRATVEQILVRAGAQDDVFTASLLGDLPSLRGACSLLTAQRSMPAILPATSWASRRSIMPSLAGRLRRCGCSSPSCARRRGSGRALRGAVARADVPMVEMLLARGADAAKIGVGTWVLHPQLAPLLASLGASVGSSGAWIGACCTGNQGRKADPDYVRALLQHGARADDVRTNDHGRTTGVQALAATGLHFAAKAGFAQTVAVLLQHGADPSARDSRGRTPLDWLEECAHSAAKEQVRRLLTASQHRSA